MKCVETFKNREAACEKQRLLRARGIEARVMVDPLESLYPALSTMRDVALMVRDESVREALAILRDVGPTEKAS